MDVQYMDTAKANWKVVNDGVQMHNNGDHVCSTKIVKMIEGD